MHWTVAIAGERRNDPGAEILREASLFPEDDALENLRPVREAVCDYAQPLGTKLGGELAIGAYNRLTLAHPGARTYDLLIA